MKLRPFQQAGVDFLVENPRAILADEMGVGKTAQALFAARELVEHADHASNILVVCPKSARGEWADQAREWLGIEAHSYNGTGRVWDPEARIVITNYKLLGEIADHRQSWGVVIFDEAHKLRNARKRKAKPDGTPRGPWRDVHRLMPQHGVYFLTGTPITKNAGDLFPLLNIIDRKRFASYWAFVKRWAITYHNGYGYIVEGSKDEAKLRHELRELMIRRTKAEVMPELPPKQRSRVSYELSSKQAKHYRELAKQAMTEIGDGLLIAPGTLAKLTRLRQLLVCPRVLGIDDDGAALEALVERLEGADAPALVFTPFAEALPYIGAALEKAGIEVSYVSGKTRDIQAVVKAFEASDNPARALIATAQQGTAWTAVSASQTHHLGWLWNPSDNAQAEDRTHRHGQRASVNNYYYLAEGTIDDDGMDIIAGKKRVADLVLGDALRIRP